LALILLSVLLALPCLALGIAGLAGSLAEASYAENIRLAIPDLAIAAGAFAPAIWWFSSARAKFRPGTIEGSRRGAKTALNRSPAPPTEREL